VTGRGPALDDAAWDSPWRRRCVRDKAVLSVGLLGCAVLLPWWPGGVLTALIATVVLVGPAGLAPAVLGRSLLAPGAFIAVGAASLLITVSWQGGPAVGLAPSPEPALTVTVRGCAATLAVFVLAATTPAVDLISAVGRLRVPQACLDVTAVAYRMVFVLAQSVRAVRAAQVARLGYDDRRAAMGSIAALVGAVWIRAWEHAGRLEAGLAGRGGTDSLRTLDPPAVASARFLIASVMTPIAVAAAAYLAVPR
jgi:cobalt/nickel transport system permease protein